MSVTTAKDGSFVRFKGSPDSWRKASGATGSTGKDHPWRAKSQRMIARMEAPSETLDGPLSATELDLYGIPFVDEALENVNELERFEAEHHLERAGIDRVMDRYSRAFMAGEVNDDE